MTTQLWQQAEEAFAVMCKGKVVTDMNLQYKDIDVITDKGNTVSVKCQTGCYKYNGVLFEVQLESTHTSKQPIKGSLLKCEATYYAVYFTETQQWVCFDTEKLKARVLGGGYKKRSTREATEAANRKQNRVYDRTINISIPPKELLTFSDAIVYTKENSPL